MPKASEEVLKEHYKEHAARKFYQELIDSMSSGPIVILHLRGSRAVARVRKLQGGTDPSAAEPGTLRGTFGIDKTNNFMVRIVLCNKFVPCTCVSVSEVGRTAKPIQRHPKLKGGERNLSKAALASVWLTV